MGGLLSRSPEYYRTTKNWNIDPYTLNEYQKSALHKNQNIRINDIYYSNYVSRWDWGKLCLYQDPKDIIQYGHEMIDWKMLSENNRVTRDFILLNLDHPWDNKEISKRIHPNFMLSNPELIKLLSWGGLSKNRELCKGFVMKYICCPWDPDTIKDRFAIDIRKERFNLYSKQTSVKQELYTWRDLHTAEAIATLNDWYIGVSDFTYRLIKVKNDHVILLPYGVPEYSTIQLIIEMGKDASVKFKSISVLCDLITYDRDTMNRDDIIFGDEALTVKTSACMKFVYYHGSWFLKYYCERESDIGAIAAEVLPSAPSVKRTHLSKECSICKDRPCDIMLAPCYHSLCEVCYGRYPKVCAECRCAVVEAVKIQEDVSVME